MFMHGIQVGILARNQLISLGESMPNPNSQDPKATNVVANGRERSVTDDELTFNQVAGLAFDPVPSGPNIAITITFRRGHGNKPEGSLLPGDTVKVKEGMIFNVSVTDKS